MPSGFTAVLEKKQPTLKEFTLQCARNFGALILMRDESWDKPIPDEFEADNRYHTSAIDSLVRERGVLLALTDEQLMKKTLDAYVKELERVGEANKQAFDNYKRATLLEAEIMVWEPPTKDHVGLKNFMLEQVREFIRYDAHKVDAPAPPIMKDMRETRLAAITEEIRYHEKEIEAENRRTRERNDWVRALRESLK